MSLLYSVLLSTELWWLACARTARGKVWGSDEVNVEGWKPLKRLPGHESGESPCALISGPCIDVSQM